MDTPDKWHEAVRRLPAPNDKPPQPKPEKVLVITVTVELRQPKGK